MILFLSSAFFPANLMLEPAATVAEYNPLSFIVEGIRDPVISSLSLEAFAKALGRSSLLGAISLGAQRPAPCAAGCGWAVELNAVRAGAPTWRRSRR